MSWGADCHQLVFLNTFFFLWSLRRRSRCMRRTLAFRLYPSHPPLLWQGAADLAMHLTFVVTKLTVVPTGLESHELSGHRLPLPCGSLITAPCHQVAWYSFQDPLMNIPAELASSLRLCQVVLQVPTYTTRREGKRAGSLFSQWAHETMKWLVFPGALCYEGMTTAWKINKLHHMQHLIERPPGKLKPGRPGSPTDLLYGVKWITVLAHASLPSQSGCQLHTGEIEFY